MEYYTGDILNNIQKGKHIICFSTPTCIDCITLDNYIQNVINTNPEWQFTFLNRDEYLDLARKYNVYGIPSFLAFENGEKISELISSDAKPESLINNWIKTIGLI